MSEAISYEEWKAKLANALDVQFNWKPGSGLLYVADEAEEVWRDAYDHGLSPDEMAYQEFAGMLADEGDPT
ncbi:hypothetical protein HYPGJ_31505 [Hyphomicrobium sp. GJ21]|uniref:hypothetical protein n=1 Tax=Hyphomicrobium sp. GJ21 TaxID=113574 RepID=UPI000622BED2|nr:hypothetical protein [Hyphomicrobium sp. GJ21]CEJ87980.1 hypothetical protein HYPGJ_31505 [Hyphomicrobium sp. GJ21]